MRPLVTTQKLIVSASVVFLLGCLLILATVLYPLKEVSADAFVEIVSYYFNPIVTTLLLSVTTGILVLAFALTAAVSQQFVARKFQKVTSFLLALPLIFPPYIAAITYIDIFKSTFVLRLIGTSQVLEFFQAVFVLSLFLYPYSYLLIKTRLEMIDPSHKKIMSLYQWSFVEKVRLLYIPHLKGVFLSGFLLSFLYVVSDFGAVSILRMDTITTELYQSMIKRLAYDEAAVLSLILMFIAGFSVAVGSHVAHNSSTSLRKAEPETVSHPGIGKYISWLCILLLLLFSIAIPITKIAVWFFQFLESTSILKNIWFDPLEFGSLVTTTIIIASTVVLITQFFGLFFQTARAFFPTLPITRAVSGMMTIYYSLPAIVITFGVLTMKVAIPQEIELGFVFLLIAYLMRFGGLAFMTISPAIDIIPSSYMRIGSIFIQGYYSRIKAVIWPYIKDYLSQSAHYVFLLSLRELTVPLVLLPLGVHVLSVRIWQTASEGMYQYASPSIIILLLLSMPSMVWYIRART